MSQNFSQYEIPEAPKPELPIEAIAGGAVLKDGEFKSPNFVTGQKGWKIDSEGNAEFISIKVGKKHGVTTRDNTSASGVQNIAHGLGTTPNYVRITAKYVVATNSSTEINSVGVYNGVTTSTIWMGGSVAGSDIETDSNTTNIIFIKESSTGPVRQVATIAVDATNITLTWTKSGTPSGGNIQILWEAFA